jgi:hypothetical protein
MKALRRRVAGLPENLSAHVLRHSWNDAFSDAMDRKGIPGDEAKWCARLMGWRREESAEAYFAAPSGGGQTKSWSRCRTAWTSNIVMRGYLTDEGQFGRAFAA